MRPGGFHMMTLLLGLALASGAVVDDKSALQGMKDGKIVYDITEGDGKALESFEEAEQEYDSLGIQAAE